MSVGGEGMKSQMDRQAWGRSYHDPGAKPRKRAPSDKLGRTRNSKQRQRRRVRIFERDGYRCAGCGETFPAKKLTLDHIVPASKGGSDRRENLQTMCRPCNTAKADTLPEAGV